MLYRVYVFRAERDTNSAEVTQNPPFLVSRRDARRWRERHFRDGDVFRVDIVRADREPTAFRS